MPIVVSEPDGCQHEGSLGGYGVASGRGWRALPEIYEFSGAGSDFRHNVQRTDLPVGVKSVVVIADLPSSRSTAAWRALLNLGGAPLAMTLV